MSDRPTLLLVGGTGFVGGHMAPALRAAFPDHRHVMLRRGEEATSPGWEVMHADLLDPAGIDDVVARLKPSLVVHLAAQASIMAAVDAAESTWRVNFGGAFAMASAMARHAPGGTFFFTSSAEVYGRSFIFGRAAEETPPQPGNAYAASKLAAEYAIGDLLSSGSRLIIARAFNHTGPGQDERFVLPTFAAQIARIEAGLVPAVVRVGDLSAQRDFLHVADVVDAYIRLLKMPASSGRLTVNVSSGLGHRIGDLLDLLRGMARVPVAIEQDPARMRPSGIPVAIGDPSRLKGLVGWEPRHTMGQILSELLDYWRERVASGR